MAKNAQGQTLIFQQSEARFTVNVRADERRLTGLLEVTVHGPEGPVPSPAEVIKALAKAPVKFCSDLADRLQEALAGGSRIAGLVVAVGKPPEKGTPGRLEWKVDIQAARERQVKVVGDQADYREIRHFVPVQEGNELLKVIPPGIGPAGEDILGRPIPGCAGDPAMIQFGDNVRFDEKAGTAFAAATGSVDYQDNRVDVTPVWHVRGDVSYETGNIDFPGDVIVRGNVLDDFRVESKKNITVFGSVYAASLKTDGDIRIHHGASGRGVGALAAGGEIQAKFLNAINVTCGGDLIVANEILHCKVQTGGSLMIPMGRIVGGEVVAWHAVEARQLGSSTSTPTNITVGIDIATAQQIAQLKTGLAELAREIERAYLLVRAHIDDPRTLAALPEWKRERAEYNMGLYAAKRRQEEELKAQLGALEIEESDPEEQLVKVLRSVGCNVTITIGNCSETFAREIPGPVTFIAGAGSELQRL